MNKIEFTIESARPEDSEQWVRVVKESWLTTYPNAEYGITREDILAKNFESPERIERYAKLFVDSENSFYLSAKVDGRVVGVLIGVRHDDRNEVKVLYLLPEYFRKGIGSALMKRAFELFDADKETFATVAVYNEKAISFYKKFGFEITGPATCGDECRLPSGKVLPRLEMIRII